MISHKIRFLLKSFFPIFLMAAVLIVPQVTHAMEPIFAVLKNTSSGEGKTVMNVWKSLMDISNTFVIVVLIGMALAQILRININTYGVKKILPTLVFAIIAANFSFLFCRLMVDFSNAVLSVFFEGVNNAGPTLNQQGGVANFQQSLTVDIGSPYGITGGGIFWFIVGQFLKIGAGILILILAFLFLVRNWMIYFLVALGPFAIMSMTLPQTKSLFTQWWSNLMKWTFMPIVSVFWLWVGAQWFNASFASDVWLVNYVFAGVCAYLALTNPFKMGGAIMNQWGGLGKKLWGRTGEAAWKATGGAGVNAVKSAINTRYDRQKQKLKNRWYGTRPGQAMIRRGAAQKYLTQQEQDIHNKRLGDAEKDVYYRAYQDHLAGRRPLQSAQLSRLYAKLRSYIGDERETFSSLPPERLQAELNTRHALYTDADFENLRITDPAERNALRGKLKSEEHMAATMTRDQMIESKAIIARARQMLNNTITRDGTIVVMGGVDRRGNHHDGIIPLAQEANWRSGDIARSLYAVSPVGIQDSQEIGSAVYGIMPVQANQVMSSVAEHKNIGEILEQHKESLAKLTPEARRSVEDSLKQICEERDRAVADLMSGPEEEINHITTGIKILASAKARGYGLDSAELEKELSKAREAIAARDMEKIKELPEIIRGAGMGIDSKNPAYLAALQRRVEHIDAADNHLKSLKGYALMDAQAQLMKNPDQYVQNLEKSLKIENAAKAKANVTGQMAAGNLAANPALQGVNLSNIGNNEHALSEIASSLEGLSQQMHELGKSPLADPHAISPGAVADKAEFMNMAKDVMKTAQQSAFAGGAPAAGTLGDMRTRQIFADQLGKATAQAMTKAFKRSPMQVNVVNKPGTPVPVHQPQPPQQPQPQAPATPVPEPPNQPPQASSTPKA